MQLDQPTHFEDPVAAYDLLAANYSELARCRDAYLRSVETLIRKRIPAGSRALLDIGGGDGTRAGRIARAGGIGRVVVLEPSAGMVRGAPRDLKLWPMRAEELDPEIVSDRFDVITCLWNVLGHVRGREARQRALGAFARLMSAGGAFFLDVSHRYNFRAYGLVPTTLRWIHDHVLRNEINGDVIARWKVGERNISTYGHVFTHREIARLAEQAGLEIVERVVVDYGDGRRRRLSCLGNLLYVFRRSSRIDSSSARQTS